MVASEPSSVCLTINSWKVNCDPARHAGLEFPENAALEIPLNPLLVGIDDYLDVDAGAPPSSAAPRHFRNRGGIRGGPWDVASQPPPLVLAVRADDRDEKRPGIVPL
jgi:hypothetical protein